MRSPGFWCLVFLAAFCVAVPQSVAAGSALREDGKVGKSKKKKNKKKKSNKKKKGKKGAEVFGLDYAAFAARLEANFDRLFAKAAGYRAAA